MPCIFLWRKIFLLKCKGFIQKIIKRKAVCKLTASNCNKNVGYIHHECDFKRNKSWSTNRNKILRLNIQKKYSTLWTRFISSVCHYYNGGTIPFQPQSCKHWKVSYMHFFLTVNPHKLSWALPIHLHSLYHLPNQYSFSPTVCFLRNPQWHIDYCLSNLRLLFIYVRSF